MPNENQHNFPHVTGWGQKYETLHTSYTLVVTLVIKLTVSRHEESKQADNNMQISCQAISCSVVKLSTNMWMLNKTCSARWPHQVVQMSWPLWTWCACQANNILLNAVIVKASRHMTYQRSTLSASPMTMLSLLMDEKTTQTPDEYFRAFCTPPLQWIYRYICKEPPDSLICCQIQHYILLYHMSSATIQCCFLTLQIGSACEELRQR
jgi:hypothetical protein